MTETSYSHPDLKKVIEVIGNDNCVDCGSDNPQYACLLNSVLLCFNCAEFHKSFDSHISSVSSLINDSWSPEELTILKLGGNSRFLKNLCDYEIIEIKNPYCLSAEKSRQKYCFIATEYYRNLISSEVNNSDKPDKPSLEEGKLLLDIPDSEVKETGDVAESQQSMEPKDEKLGQKVKNMAASAYKRSKKALSSTGKKINNSELTQKLKIKSKVVVVKLGNAGEYLSDKASNFGVSQALTN